VVAVQLVTKAQLARLAHPAQQDQEAMWVPKAILGHRVQPVLLVHPEHKAHKVQWGRKETAEQRARRVQQDNKEREGRKEIVAIRAP